jgi:hypothetical protein
MEGPIVKKRFLIPTIAGLAMLGLIAFGLNLAQKPTGRLTVSYAAESELPPGSIIPTSTKDAAGTVVDYAESLTEMATNADLIVVAKVTDQQQFSYVSVASTAQPLRVLKGSAPSSLTIFQLGSLTDRSDGLLQTGTTYFLFLGKQSDASPNTFYVKGEHQGIFEKRGNQLIGLSKFVESLNLKPGADPYQVLEDKVKASLT